MQTLLSHVWVGLYIISVSVNVDEASLLQMVYGEEVHY